MLTHREIEILRKGPRICLQFHATPTKKRVNIGGFFSPDWVTLDTEYWDEKKLMDPTRSDFPTMLKLEALGCVRRTRWADWVNDWMQYEWRVTDAGRAEMNKVEAA